MTQHQQSQSTVNTTGPTSWPTLGKAIAYYICARWEEMLLEVEEGISATDTPLSADKLLIETVIQRKHLFGYLRRQVSMIYQWAARTSGTHNDYPLLERLKACKDKLKEWTEELDQVSNSLLGMLSISESIRAGFQAARTENITILAFIFIPISTVASIYGMNVVDFSGVAANPKMKSLAYPLLPFLLAHSLLPGSTSPYLRRIRINWAWGLFTFSTDSFSAF